MEHQSDFSSEDDGNGLSSDSNEEIEFEDLDSFDGDAPSNSEEGSYCQEPLTDEDWGEGWLYECNRERKKITKRKQQLQNQFKKNDRQFDRL